MLGYIRFADRLSAWFGKAFAWLIMVMAIGVGYEVVVRYGFNAPTSWAFDLSYITYGTLFMMGGAYTLSRGGHVRGDFIYRLWKPRTQGRVELVLYFLFFFPGVIALIISGWKYAERSWRYLEVSVNSPAGIPIFQFKTVIVAAGILLFIQGIAQVFRCIICIRTGEWLVAAEDVEETEVRLAREKELEAGDFAAGTSREDGRGLKQEYSDQERS
ncbi:MAG: TRAP transporter small permease subunit [Candidatus Thiodiazotropha sp. (ex Lucinoma annulata)]|nr:TRAP transporter small permease subunit [Candidatus Thiodiazotropha sp. (ex Lucinoma borealis)]MCU7869863.1 TRAP transporter small permease subunit [Candidatus Thiodiazotropha sp. (ex Lucinoma borealis)]MCU7873067.1 TRAP transporter small permease subunit [Candidatus Thiodiazotropha sp. (ex Lucinoma borealis)]MCU7875347.1 TRAP transporter small permease subunit [Candidatus Thiodiazotropha sp. (ex Lucinoma borealis)]MCU7884628.1 TRAP transporter small permease subunit [Candidatus Thiodiazotro